MREHEGKAYQGKLYDVVVMGGGPAGATLATRLRREAGLEVAIFEAGRFPREHIGESFVHTVVTSLEQSGALEKVLRSECYIKKAGGYYAWEKEQPWSTFFEHAFYERDGHTRWAMHVDRAEFDHILLEHARACGVEVYEDTPVTAVERRQGETWVSLGEQGSARGRIFVNASGRTGNTTITGERAFLSDYRNIAVWGHVFGGRPAQSLPGAWNVFRQHDLSPIACFAFEDGWFWYIPVPKIVRGERVLTHSLGLVTDPAALLLPGKRYTNPDVLMDTARQTRLLRDLIDDATWVYPALHTATNYSRISGRMCDWDTGEIRIGDAAYFVDPLFSSGVHFALLHAAAATTLIKVALDGSVEESLQRELWDEYDGTLRSIAHAFALGIDQWYSEIARANPDSVYWKRRAGGNTFDDRRETFHALVNGAVHQDLLQVITRGTREIDSLGEEGALRQSFDRLHGEEPPSTAWVRLKSGVGVRAGLTLDPGVPPDVAIPGSKPLAIAHGPYWEDPIGRSHEVSHFFATPIPCHYFYFEDTPARGRIKFIDALHGGLSLRERLRSPQVYGKLKESLPPAAQHLLLHMALAGMLDIQPPDVREQPLSSRAAG